jgi:XTP/dITP diphosphohydrolase
MLDGAPGIFSARYAGERASDKENLNKLLRELARRNIPLDQRTARFRCALVLAKDGVVLHESEGSIEGTIAERAKGLAGFGYDPVFVPNGFDRTFAELSPKVKNRLSHRARAVLARREVLLAKR